MKHQTALTLLPLLCAASFALLVVPLHVDAATLKLANGDTVDGEIQGRIVMPVTSEELVGEYRLNHYAETAQLTGTIRIKTATGEVLTFPVSDIAPPSW